MPGERFIDALLADTLSERYRPSEVDEDHQRLMDAGVRIAHTYAEQRGRIAVLDTCEAVEDAMRAWQKVLKKSECEHNYGKYLIDDRLICAECDGTLGIKNGAKYIPHDEISFVRAPLQECEETLKLTSGGLDDHDCLRPPLDRLCDWFAGLFSVDAVAMPID